MVDAGPKLITLAEAATRLGLDRVATQPERVIKRMIRSGRLRGVRVQKWWMVDPVSVDRYTNPTGKR